MAAPIYTQAQADGMIVAKKKVEHDAWQDRFDGRPSTEDVRTRIRAYPIDEADLTEFTIELCNRPARDEVSFTLMGKLLGYPEHPLCRYELQICTHRNPKWFSPGMIGRRVLHKHVYNERALREGWDWDKCAEPLPQPKRKLSLRQSLDHLTPLFLDQLNIEIYDPDVNKALFNGV